MIGAMIWFAFERYADECVSRTERSPRGSKLRGALGHTELARTQSGDLTVIEKEMASISGFSCAPLRGDKQPAAV